MTLQHIFLFYIHSHTPPGHTQTLSSLSLSLFREALSRDCNKGVLMADRYPYYVSNRSEEFDEEDVWAVVKERKVRKAKEPSPVSTLRRLPTASRTIPRANNKYEAKVQQQQQSAPVNIPDWSKIYTKNSSHRGCSWAAAADDVNVDHDKDKDNDDDDDDGDDEDEWVPPHEWISKKLARTQISSFSVCEGAGRTLKGRDLSKVRNAVLTRTGFLE